MARSVVAPSVRMIRITGASSSANASAPLHQRCPSGRARFAEVAWIAEAGSSGLLRRKRRLGAFGYQPALLLGERRIKVQHERTCIPAKLGDDKRWDRRQFGCRSAEKCNERSVRSSVHSVTLHSTTLLAMSVVGIGGLAGSLNSHASKSRQLRRHPMDEQSVSVVLRQSRQSASGLSHSSLERNYLRRELRCCYLPRLSNMSRSK